MPIDFKVILRCGGLMSCSYQDHSVVGLLQLADTYIRAYVHVAVKTTTRMLGRLRERIYDILRRRKKGQIN